MEKMVSLAAVFLFIGMTTATPCGSQDRNGDEPSRDRFVGAWRLVSLEAPGPDGELHNADSAGIVPIPGTTKLARMEENLGATGVELTPSDVRALEDASSKIKLEGARYPAFHANLVGR